MELEAGPSASGASATPLPVIPFVENVEEFLAGRSADAVLAELRERHQQYKLMEMRLLAKRRDLEGKVPDIKKCLRLVQELQERQSSGEETKVDCEIAEKIYAGAAIKDVNSVCLWLGANVMLEYPFEEAVQLLQDNISNATTSLAAIVRDMQFLRDQITTAEVTMARIYNYDVQARRKKRELEAAMEET